MIFMPQNWNEIAFQNILDKIEKTSSRIQDGIPYVSKGEQYSDMSRDMGWWTNGFWSGILWLAYRHTKNPEYRLWAQSCENKLDSVLRDYYRVDHDAGFLWH